LTISSDLQNVQRQEIEQLHRMYKAKIEGIQEVMQHSCFPCRLAIETIEHSTGGISPANIKN
jgi:hypothetical protein